MVWSATRGGATALGQTDRGWIDQGAAAELREAADVGQCGQETAGPAPSGGQPQQEAAAVVDDTPFSTSSFTLSLATPSDSTAKITTAGDANIPARGTARSVRFI